MNMKKKILIAFVVGVFATLGVQGIYDYFATTVSVKLPTGEIQRLDKPHTEGVVHYKSGQQILLSRALSGDNDKDWHVHISYGPTLMQDTILRGVTFEKSDAWPDEDPLTNGDIELKIATVN